MSIPLVDLHLKFIVDHTLRTVRNDPDKHLASIFGDAKIEPHAALYGNNLILNVKTWLQTTNVPVVLGFELDPSQFPGVSINLEGSTPSQAFMGDAGDICFTALEDHEREIIIQPFSPKNLVLSVDGSYYEVTLPDDFDQDENKILPGLHWRDKKGQYYAVGQSGITPTIVAFSDGVTLPKGDFGQLTVVSPLIDARYRQGVMWYEENALITIHGHADRTEGLWLWAIVHWGFLKFRPLMISTLGLDLGMPRASDFSKDDSYLGTNVWRRFITLSTKTLYQWEASKLNEVVGFLQSVQTQAQTQGQANTSNILLEGPTGSLSSLDGGLIVESAGNPDNKTRIS